MTKRSDIRDVDNTPAFVRYAERRGFSAGLVVGFGSGMVLGVLLTIVLFATMIESYNCL